MPRGCTLAGAIDACKIHSRSPYPNCRHGTDISGKSYRFAFQPFYSGWRQIVWKAMALSLAEESSEAILTLTLQNDQIVEVPIG